MEKRLSDMALLIKNITTYQKIKLFYVAYRKARNIDSILQTEKQPEQYKFSY